MFCFIQEDPGESLSDCDKDTEEDHLEEETLKIEDEDESEDGFVVPDGYLSEDEVLIAPANIIHVQFCLSSGLHVTYVSITFL